MKKRTLFLEWPAFDDQAVSPLFNKPVQGVVLDYGAPSGVDDATLVETDRGPRMVPVGAGLFAAFTRTLPDLAVVDARSYEALIDRIKAAIASGSPCMPAEPKPALKEITRAYVARPPGPTPGH